MKKVVAVITAAVLLILSSGCSFSGNEAHNGSNSYEKSENNYSISTSSKEATEAGAKILAAGGNAVDAAIAASYALSVAEPYASGIGGGGGMTIYDPKSDNFFFIDYCAEAAQSGAYVNQMGVPGFVAGMQKAGDLFGSVEMSELIKPAIELAENGITVSESLKTRIDDAIASFNTASTPFAGVKTGDKLVQTELASTLKTIASEGMDAFYKGSITEAIIKSSDFTAEDFSSYAVIVSDAVTGKFGSNTVASAPPPFSGITLIQMIKMMEMVNIPNPGSQREQFLKDFIKIKLVATSDRASNLADSRFSEKGKNYYTHIEPEYLETLLKKDTSKYREEIENEDTTHISVTDKNGMVVSCTNTLSQFFGARVYVNGFFINNSLRNFSATGINAYKPGKRPRTFISPTIIKNYNGGLMAIGTPGGNVIPTVLSLVISDVEMFNTAPQDAVDKMRIFIKSEDTINVETGLDSELYVDPNGLGYYVVPYTSNIYFGSINIAGYNNENGYYAAYDKRRDGYCVAVNN